MTFSELPTAKSVLAVCAHPDDESFGLGAILGAFHDQGAQLSVLCFTRGEASTLHDREADLAVVRTAEFARAADVLGVSRSELLDYPDGHLAEQAFGGLVAHVIQLIQETATDLLLVFDEGGISGHSDHVQATKAATAAGTALQIPVLAWAISDEVAIALNQEFGAGFLGCSDDQLDFRVVIDRVRQHQAIACHRSQSVGNPVLARRLQLSGGVEQLRWLTSVVDMP